MVHPDAKPGPGDPEIPARQHVLEQGTADFPTSDAADGRSPLAEALSASTESRRVSGLGFHHRTKVRPHGLAVAEALGPRRDHWSIFTAAGRVMAPARAETGERDAGRDDDDPCPAESRADRYAGPPAVPWTAEDIPVHRFRQRYRLSQPCAAPKRGCRVSTMTLKAASRYMLRQLCGAECTKCAGRLINRRRGDAGTWSPPRPILRRYTTSRCPTRRLPPSRGPDTKWGRGKPTGQPPRRPVPECAGPEKERLPPALSSTNVEKTHAAPVVSSVAHDTRLFETCRACSQGARRRGPGSTASRRRYHGRPHGTLQGAYISRRPGARWIAGRCPASTTPTSMQSFSDGRLQSISCAARYGDLSGHQRTSRRAVVRRGLRNTLTSRPWPGF